MFVGLIIILLMVLTLPFVVKKVEHNLEVFLFVMGLSATIIYGVLSANLILEVFENKLIYFITFAVLIAGLIFMVLKDRVKGIIGNILKRVPLRVFVFFVIVILGLELLGAGFKPLIDTYIISLDSRLLYFINMISAVLDNATLAAAEISIKMTPIQIESVLMGLLII